MFNIQQSPREFRLQFIRAFQSYLEKKTLTPLENQMIECILLHPEYHLFLKDESYVDTVFNTETHGSHPFLHLAFHLGLNEQITTNRPAGIRSLFNQYKAKIKEPHEAMHHFMEILMFAMHNQYNDEQYLSHLTTFINQSNK